MLGGVGGGGGDNNSNNVMLRGVTRFLKSLRWASLGHKWQCRANNHSTSGLQKSITPHKITLLLYYYQSSGHYLWDNEVLLWHQKSIIVKRASRQWIMARHIYTAHALSSIIAKGRTNNEQNPSAHAYVEYWSKRASEQWKYSNCACVSPIYLRHKNIITRTRHLADDTYNIVNKTFIISTYA